MLDIFAKFATDEKLEIEGAWQPFQGTRVLIARVGNPAYSKMLNKLITENKDVLDREDDAADALSKQIMIDVYASKILLGWEDFGFKGEPLPYSLANAKMLLGVNDFRAAIATLANKFDAYKVKQEMEQGEA